MRISTKVVDSFVVGFVSSLLSISNLVEFGWNFLFKWLLLLVTIFCGTDLRFLLLLEFVDDETGGGVFWLSSNETVFVDVADKPSGLDELFESFVPLSHELFSTAKEK